MCFLPNMRDSNPDSENVDDPELVGDISTSEPQPKPSTVSKKRKADPSAIKNKAPKKIKSAVEIEVPKKKEI